MRNAVDWWRELDFERRQRLNVKGCKFVGCHNLEMFATPTRERDLFHKAVEPVLAGGESFCYSDILTPVMFSNLTDKAQSGIELERNLVQKVAEAVRNVTSFGVFLRGAWHAPIEPLEYLRMISV